MGWELPGLGEVWLEVVWPRASMRGWRMGVARVGVGVRRRAARGRRRVKVG